jgi:hypothetical protein
MNTEDYFDTEEFKKWLDLCRSTASQPDIGFWVCSVETGQVVWSYQAAS